MAKPGSLRKQGGGTDESFRLQSNVESAYGNLSKSIILDGVFLEGVSVTTGESLVEHKLDRPFRGYIICKNDTFSSIKSTDAKDTSKFITLTATANCTISLWVF